MSGTTALTREAIAPARSPELATLLSRLPDPDLHPDRPVVIFDGHCGFCQQGVASIRRGDRNKLAYLSLHDPRVGERYPDLSREDLLRQMYVVTPDGARYGGPEALKRLVVWLPKFWWMAPFLWLPMTGWFWRRAYDWVAKNRYRISKATCDTGSCAIPPHGTNMK